MKRYAIILDDFTPSHADGLTAALNLLKFDNWHRIQNIWLCLTDDGMTANDLKGKLRPFIGNSSILVLECSREFSSYLPIGWADWISGDWHAKKLPDGTK
jgi:hypothetical protein